jgi:hypothetical protein
MSGKRYSEEFKAEVAKQVIDQVGRQGCWPKPGYGQAGIMEKLGSAVVRIQLLKLFYFRSRQIRHPGAGRDPVPLALDGKKCPGWQKVKVAGSRPTPGRRGVLILRKRLEKRTSHQSNQQ